MLSRILQISKLACNMPWQLVLTRGLLRVGLDSAWTRKVDFLNSPDTLRPNKAVQILLNSMRCVGLSPASLATAIPGARVLEIGCGRHIGFASFVLGLGATEYIGIDPALDQELFFYQVVRDGYLAVALREAKNLANSLPEFRELPFDESDGIDFLDSLLNQCRFIRGGIDEMDAHQDKMDICLSISCLEHIRDFGEAARVIASLSKPNTMHVHVVNFSSHLSKESPFSQLYDMSYEDFDKRWKHNINGLRVSDMLKEFNQYGLRLRALPLDAAPGALPARIHPYWTDKYRIDELAMRTAVLTSL